MPEKWRYTADYMVSCNCDYGCPCNFNARPTKGQCEGVVAIRIKDGAFGSTALRGLKGVIAAWWPGAIHEGGGVMQSYVDVKASDAQRIALSQILSGEVGGPWALFAKTYKTLPPKSSRIEFEAKAKRSRLGIDGTLTMEF